VNLQLLSCVDILVVLRLFYGVLMREGLRVSELLGLEISDFDLENGVLVLDENKTDEPRQWAMGSSTVEALRLYVRHLHPDPRPEARMFLATASDFDPSYVTLCLRIWSEQGLSLRTIGKKLGVSQVTICNVLRGHQSPGPRVIEGFAEALSDGGLPEVSCRNATRDSPRSASIPTKTLSISPAGKFRWWNGCSQDC
jgi:hypothetical protein